MANHPPQISVVFPVYNVQDVVVSSLRSLLAQSFRDFEILIIDDAGQDESMNRIRNEIANSATDIDIRIIAHPANKGLSEARNTGIRHAHGEYIFFMDSDDELSDDALQLHYQAIMENQADFTDANVRLIAHPDIFIPFKQNQVINNRKEVLNAFFTSLHVSAWNKLVRRSLIIDNDIFFVGGMLYEDVCWLLALAKASQSCVCLAHYTYDYIIRQNSITRADSRQKLLYRVDSYKKMLSQASEMTRNLQPSSLQAASDRWLVKFIVRVKYNVVKMALTPNEKKQFFRWCASLNRSCRGVYGIANRLPLSTFRLLIVNTINLLRRS